MVKEMSFKTATQLKIDANKYAESKTLEVIRGELATKLEKEANEGGRQIEYFNPSSVNNDHLTAVLNELNSLGYKAEIKETVEYKLLTINW